MVRVRGLVVFACVVWAASGSAQAQGLLPLPGVIDQLNLPAPLVNLPAPVINELNTVCSGTPVSQACTEAVEQILNDVPAALIGALEVPPALAGFLDATCDTVPLSASCQAILSSAVQSLPTYNQAIVSAAASNTVFTNQQIADFALSSITVLPPAQTAAALRVISPTVSTFGVSGVAKMDHDGFSFRSPFGSGRTASFESFDVGGTLGMRFDASRAANLPRDSLSFGVFGNYTNSEVDFDLDPALRVSGLRGGGEASLDNGSAGMFGLLSNGKVYGLAIASGQFGSATVKDPLLEGRSKFDTSGFAGSLLAGTVIPVARTTKFDLRGGLNFLNARAEEHRSTNGLRFGEGEIEAFSGMASVRVFQTWLHGQSVIRPFAQIGIDQRFDYENQVRVGGVDFSFDEGDTTLFGRVGVDMDVADRVQAFAALRGDHNEDFDIGSAQIGFTLQLN